MPTLSSLAPAPRPAAAPGDRTAEWRALFGRGWRGWLAAGAVLVFVVGAVAPLADPDFGMHLRIGEWIVAHGRVPTVEPFAWTRQGRPFYAYSWLAEVAYYGALRALGPLGPHLLHGAEGLAGAGAVWAFARARELGALATLLLVLLHVATVGSVAPDLRPHLVLAVAVPAAWAAAAVLARAPSDGGAALGRARWGSAARLAPYAALFVAAAVAANAHLLAPMVAAPLALLVGPAAAPGGRRRLAAAAACVAAGLACTPYAAHWADVYRLNFTPNALFRFPSPIGEHVPGMVAVTRDVPVWGAFALWLALVPWLVPAPAPAFGPATGDDDVRVRQVERAVLAVLWVAGLALFGLAIRGLLVWWLVTLPLTAAAIGRVPAPSGGRVGRALARVPFALPVLLAVHDARLTWAARAWEGWRAPASGGAAVAHTAVAVNARGAMALADTLERLAPGAAGARVLTNFNYGNALLWRLPRLSMSVDGRTIFPDSAEKLDAYVLAADSARVPDVAGSAEVAILPLRHAVARRLTPSAGWRRVAVARVAPPPALAGLVRADTAALWVTERWAARWMR